MLCNTDKLRHLVLPLSQMYLILLRYRHLSTHNSSCCVLPIVSVHITYLVVQ